MKKSKGLRSFSAVAVTAAALLAAQPAAADVIEINNFWAGAGTATINFTGTNWHDGSTVTGLQEYGGSGGFKTYNRTTGGNAFLSFCVDIFHSFGFVVKSEDTLQPATIISAKAAEDLGRLYTNHHAAVESTSSTATNQSAFQLAVWEIVNEGASEYSLSQGNFKASGTGGSLAQTWLNELSTDSASQYVANIWTVQHMLSGNGYAQDLVVFAPVPEPQTYAMMLVGLGLLGLSVRRKNQNLV
ncbi:MAG: PEP-CTERM sorting domain-containing protein [Pseudomonadota bacterium]